MVKVITYIDGYNLYHSLISKGWKQYLWLDLTKFSQRLLRFNQELVMTKYFTSRTTGSKAKRQRQTKYIEALGTLNYLEISEGRFQDEPEKCPKCKQTYTIPKEKKTDVNIAADMICDAFNNKFEIAILVTADADLVPAIEAIRKHRQDKRIVIGFPPGLNCEELISVAHAFLRIGRNHFAQARLPLKVEREDGFILECPTEWAYHIPK